MAKSLQGSTLDHGVPLKEVLDRFEGHVAAAGKSADTRQIAGVMVRGRWYTRADLDVMLKEVTKANQD